MMRFAVCILLFTASTAAAQGTADDYRRADALPQLTRNKVVRDRVQPQWAAAAPCFWYRNDLPEGRREYVLVDAEQAVRQRLFDHDRLAEALSDDVSEYALAAGPAREADTELRTSLDYDAAEHAIDADQGQEDRNPREETQQGRRESRPRDGAAHDPLERFDVDDGEVLEEGSVFEAALRHPH